jgi:hypothetical protein
MNIEVGGAVYAPLLSLIEQAEREGKWLRCGYQDICCTPAELRANNARGLFRWGPVNWELVDPQARVEAARRRLAEAQAEYDAILKKSSES